MKGLFFFESVGVPEGSPELGKGNSGWVPSPPIVVASLHHLAPPEVSIASFSLFLVKYLDFGGLRFFRICLYDFLGFCLNIMFSVLPLLFLPFSGV